MPTALFDLLSGPGFLGTRGPLFSDLVVSALGLVLPLLAAGAVAARRGNRALHGRIMACTYAVLLAVVAAFLAWNRQGGPPPSPRLETAWFYRSLYLPFLTAHICLALLALGLGPVAVWLGRAALSADAARRFGPPAGLVGRHRLVGRLTLLVLTATSVSGCGIYWARYVF